MLDGTRLDAACEVVLSSGAVGLPRLLQFSGVGSANLLSELGIDIVYDQPNVGETCKIISIYIAFASFPVLTVTIAMLRHTGLLTGLLCLAKREGPAASLLFETGEFWYVDPHV